MCNGFQAQPRTEEFVAVEVTRASLSKVAAEQLLAAVAHKKRDHKLMAYCKLYYEGPSKDGNAASVTQVMRL